MDLLEFYGEFGGMWGVSVLLVDKVMANVVICENHNAWLGSSVAGLLMRVRWRGRLWQ